jgi:hypothetical protein
MKYRARRFLTDVSVTVHAGETNNRAKIHDVSPHGARLTGSCDLKVGAALTLEHLNARLPAKVCWQGNGNYGVIFTSPLSEHRLNTVRATRGTAKPFSPPHRVARR